MVACRRRCIVTVALWLVCGVMPVWAQAPVAYRLTFPEPEHRWMEVEVTFSDVPSGPLEIRMSRTSPGRYALHEFAKNIFAVDVTDASGRALAVQRPDGHQWTVTDHDGTVRIRYRVFGDRTDGTYLAIDDSHAHINMPAALMWARGLEDRPSTVQFLVPEGSGWQIATQLMPGVDSYSFAAPNLQYLMDSPTELSAFELRTFEADDGVTSPTFRVAIHHEGSASQVDRFAGDVEAIVREATGVFGELPRFDGGTYTFIADYLTTASGDAMEHRNSTILTNQNSLGTARIGLLGSVSHEFFHAWNVERIRPEMLEPFDFESANQSGELWFAEGFTNYYAPLLLHRAGITNLTQLVDRYARTINAVRLAPGRSLRTAEEMSRLAPFVDAATSIDPTVFDNTFLSYYTWGEVIGLGLDLSLRNRSGGSLTLDDFMRAMWQEHGRPVSVPGLVANPYASADLERVLATVSGDAGFAREFFARYVQGHEVMEFGPLLAAAGLLVQPASPGASWVGDLRLQSAGNGVRIADLVPFGSPVHDAGLERDDVIVDIDGQSVTSVTDAQRRFTRGQAGDRVMVSFRRRGGELVTSVVQLADDPRITIVPAETMGQPLNAAQRAFREAWLGSRILEAVP